MSAPPEKLVGIVTPVYNGEKYLRQCIESVLSQTHQNWRYSIVNNCSTDGSLAIAQHYARLDPRVTVYDPPEFLPVSASMSRAMSLVAPDALYCKPLMADDWLYPECIEKMVQCAASDPAIGLVCAHAFNGSIVLFDSIQGTGGVASFSPGRTVCRTALLEDVYFFGSPTTTLIRTDLVRARTPFFNPINLHSDEESCYDVLQESDFCFIHQILAFIRSHSESQTSLVRGLESIFVGRVYSLMKYGPVFLSKEEFAQRRQQRFKEYYALLADAALHFAPGEFWKYHRAKLALLGAPLEPVRLARAIARQVAKRLLTPLSLIQSGTMRHPYPFRARRS